LKNFLASLFGLLVGVALIEAVLAVLIPPPLHYRYPQPLYDRDDRLGWIMKPQQHAHAIDRPVITNPLGLRSPEVAPRKQPGELRVVCLGDSQAFGKGVAHDQTYPARLQAVLAARDGSRPIEVVNTGVQGYDPVQEIELLQRLAPTLQPDIVTIGIYLNDMG